MLRIYQVDEAKKSVLQRIPIDEQAIQPELLATIAAIFGEPLSPAQAVSRILRDVRQRGDPALQDWSERLDGVRLEAFRIPESELCQALPKISKEQRAALQSAAIRIEAFHRRQPVTSWIDQQSGGTLGQLIRPLRRVGIYAPGGTAPLPSTVLMTAIPARLAGVEEIALVTPPRRNSGEVAAIILAAAQIAGVQEIYRLGGAQAIAALAYGTRSIPAVDKIVGPGNIFVTLAKQQVFGQVGIDGLAGPTETVIIADDTARPAWVAADLLAQAEHDPLAAAILLTPSLKLAQSVQAEIQTQLRSLSRKEIILLSLQARSGAVITRDLEEAIALSNEYAPEHLNLVVTEPWGWVEKIRSAGGVFLGENSYEVLGDYTAGPSHVMPTGGSARFASPLNVWDFKRTISLIALDRNTAAQISETAACIAEAEGLDAHAQAVKIRLSKE